MSRLRLTLTALATALAAGLALAAVPAASAKDGDKLVRGVCTQGSTAKLKLSDEDGRIEVEFEVDQNRNGVRWQVRLKRNGSVAARTAATTRAPSGSFEVRRVLGNGPGVDHLAAAATSPSGERCVVRAAF
jgi:hypothetical protein